MFSVKQLTMANFTGPHNNLTDRRNNPWRDQGSADEIKFVDERVLGTVDQ